MKQFAPLVLLALCLWLIACGNNRDAEQKARGKAATQARDDARSSRLRRQAPSIEDRARDLLRPTGYSFITGYAVEYDDIMGRTMHVKTNLFPKPENEHYGTGVCNVLTGGEDGGFPGIDYITVDASEGSPLESC